jgi:hypothetical protein
MKTAARLGCLLILLVQVRVFSADSPWERVVVIGASASAGFVLSEPFGGTNTDKCRLNHYLDAAIAAPHEPVKNYSTAALFLSPEGIASQQIEAATNGRPSLVIGVDFLFWFCYGHADSDAERAERFEYALKLLERIPCPLVVGDIPDASRATNSGIISISQVPGEKARLAANQRLRDWAASRPDVTLVSLEKFMQTVVANAAIENQHVSVPAGKTRNLLQGDQLHPSPRGAALLALGILDELAARQPGFSAKEVRWNLDEVFRKGYVAAVLPKTPPADVPSQPLQLPAHQAQ